MIAAAEGNPLLAVESMRALATGSTAPPPNLRRAVRAALGALPPPGRALAGLLAAAGRPLTRSELDGLGVGGLPDAEAAGTDSGLLVRHAGRLGFRHALLREAVYADLADPMPLHERVATALGPGDHAEIAPHFTLVGRAAEASWHWAAAADYARSVGALTEAAEFLTRATECAPSDGLLWLELEEVWAWLGRRDSMEQAWEQALTLLPDAQLPRPWCPAGAAAALCRLPPRGVVRGLWHGGVVADTAIPGGPAGPFLTPRLPSRRCATSPLSASGVASECSSEYRSARSASSLAPPRPGEQAGVQRSLGRQPGAGAAAAERLGHRGDHADLTAAVPIPVTACHLPRVAGRERLQRPPLTWSAP